MQRYSQSELKAIAHDCAGKITASVEGVGYFEQPFKHIVIDNFLPEALAKQSSESFPNTSDPIWEAQNDADVEVKFRTNWVSEFDIPEYIVDVIRILNSSPILKAMSERIGIPKLIPDPYFTGGGLNITKRGSLLDVHV